MNKHGATLRVVAIGLDVLSQLYDIEKSKSLAKIFELWQHEKGVFVFNLVNYMSMENFQNLFTT